MKKLLITVLIFFAAVSVAQAEGKVFQASLVPDVAIHSKDTRIEGFALSIWGENPQSAFALGFVNGSTGDSRGFSWGLFNYADDYKGVEWAWGNYAKGNFVGWQAGLGNYAGRLTGLQLGFINYAERAESGLQIGLINIIKDNEWFNNFPNELAKGMVFVNWRF